MITLDIAGYATPRPDDALEIDSGAGYGPAALFSDL
jgi:hypothetical protein